MKLKNSFFLEGFFTKLASCLLIYDKHLTSAKITAFYLLDLDRQIPVFPR